MNVESAAQIVHHADVHAHKPSNPVSGTALSNEEEKSLRAIVKNLDYQVVDVLKTSWPPTRGEIRDLDDHVQCILRCHDFHLPHTCLGDGSFRTMRRLARSVNAAAQSGATPEQIQKLTGGQALVDPDPGYSSWQCHAARGLLALLRLCGAKVELTAKERLHGVRLAVLTLCLVHPAMQKAYGESFDHPSLLCG